ncbi:GGDEF domain-containing protein [Colwellia sp. MEBiC06753]
MSMEISSQEVNNLKRSNSELKRAIKHFIEISPSNGTLANQLFNIKKALKSNDAMFTFSSLVEQYAKMKNSYDNADYQQEKAALTKFKSSIKKSISRDLSSHQLERFNEITSTLELEEPSYNVLVAAGKALDFIANDLSNIRASSNVVVSAEENDSQETGVVAADIQLASRKLIKDIIIVSKQLIKSYPNDKIIGTILQEASTVTEGKGTFFTSINLLERTTTYLTLLIQQERCAAEEMLNDIHTSLLGAFSQTTVIQQLAQSLKGSSDDATTNMLSKLSDMETKAHTINSIDGMKKHIKDSVSLLSDIVNNYAQQQNKIHSANQAKIKDLNLQIQNTSSFVDKLEKKLNVAEEVSLVDELTTVGNRKGYVLRINKERQDWQTTKQPLSLIVVDVDHFKAINDTYGHSIGDQVLKCLGQTLKKHMRSTDYVARYGGEEFVIILPATNINESIKIAQKLREVINKLKFELRRKNKVLKVTCSFGIAAFTEQTSNSTEVFNDADRALYQAKENGRDAIVFVKDGELLSVQQEVAVLEH